MGDSLTITPATQTQESGGAMTTAWSSGSITVMGSFQPGNSREAVQASMLLATTTYDVYLDPIDTSGSAVSLTDIQWKHATVAVGGKTYRSVSVPIDPVTNGCLLHWVVERYDTGEA